MDGSKTLKVFNRCKYDIGVVLMNNMNVNISPNSYRTMSVDDIMHIESLCNRRKFFSSGMLVAVDENGKEVSLEDIGGYTDEYAQENQRHFTDEEIEKNLKKPYKAFESWVSKIEDRSEIDSIIAVANRHKDEVPVSKMKILQALVPNRDLLDEE